MNNVKKTMGLNKIEHWEQILGFEGLYEVSNFGNIRSMTHKVKGAHIGQLRNSYGQPIKPYITWAGYPKVNLSNGMKKRYVYVHRLVAETFIPNVNNLKTVNHKNGVKTDNWVDNLEWCSQQENKKHAVKNGLTAYGSRCARARLNEENVKEIFKLSKTGMKGNAIAKIYGVHESAVHKILRNATWRRVAR